MLRTPCIRFLRSGSDNNLKSKIKNRKWAGFLTTLILLVGFAGIAEAGQAKIYRVGVILQGGVTSTAIDGLRKGLKELGLEEEKHFLLEIRDAKGDLKVAEEAARNLEREKVNLIFAINTSVARVTKGATAEVPVVFCAGTDPVTLGLVDSFARPGGRLTGVHFLATDLTAKRLEILKDIQPKIRRVVTFYNPGNPIAEEAARLGREEARRLHVEFIERHVGSVKELQAALRPLKAGEADAYFYTADAMMASQAQLIIEMARDKKWPTMFDESLSVAQGGLASYGISYYEAGRLSAKYVRRILAGTSPKDLPVETLHKLEFVVNLRTAKQIGLTIPPNVLARADKIIR
jgi:putative tryptophan/tyrosine transport system substrate-binding protein